MRWPDKVGKEKYTDISWHVSHTCTNQFWENIIVVLYKQLLGQIEKVNYALRIASLLGSF